MTRARRAFRYGVFRTILVGVLLFAGVALEPASAQDAPGSVAGTVDDGHGHGLAGVVVTAWLVGGTTPFGSATTSADGTYSLGELRPFTEMIVCFNAAKATGGNSAGPYASECWRNLGWTGSTDKAVHIVGKGILLAAGENRTGIGASLALASGVSGTVTSSVTGRPLAGVRVLAWDRWYDALAGVAYTNANGKYSFKHLSPKVSYRIYFDGRALKQSGAPFGYTRESWKDGPWDSRGVEPDLHHKFTLVAGQSITGVSAKLQPLGGLSGRATDPATGRGIPHLAVEIGSTKADSALTVHTDAKGRFAVQGISPENDYTVCFDPSESVGSSNGTGYGGECWKSAPFDAQKESFPNMGNRATVAPGSITRGLDMRLRFAGAIGGRVTDSSGHGIAGVAVNLYEVGSVEGTTAATTSSSGRFDITHLNPGNRYNVCFDASNATGGTSTTGYLDECWDNVAGGSDHRRVAVVPAGKTTRVNAQLGTAAAITGTVRTARGSLVPNARIKLTDDNNAWSAAKADGAGRYSFTGLDPHSTYTVCVQPATDNAELRGECWGTEPWDSGDAQAGPVSVTAGRATTVDVALPGLGSVSGRVTSTDGKPVPGIEVAAYWVDSYWGWTEVSNTLTDDSGNYDLPKLAAGTYAICANGMSSPMSSAATYNRVCWKQVTWGEYASEPTTTTAVKVSDGSAASGISFVLSHLANIQTDRSVQR